MARLVTTARKEAGHRQSGLQQRRQAITGPAAADPQEVGYQAAHCQAGRRRTIDRPAAAYALEEDHQACQRPPST